MVTDSLVLIGSCSGIFHALHRAGGREIWSYDTRPDGGPVQFHGDPVVVSDMVVTCSDRGDPNCTYAFELATGVKRWQQCEAAIESDVLWVGSSAIGRSWNGDLVALDLNSGELTWRLPPEEYRFRMRVDDSPVLYAGAVYFGHVDGSIWAVRGKSGEAIWRREIGHRIRNIAVDREHVFVGVTDGTIRRLSRSGGEITASIQTGSKPFGRPVLADSVLVMLLDDEHLAAFDADLTAMLWSRNASGGWTSYQPLLWGETVVVGDSGGSVHAFDIHDGSLVWTAEVAGRVRGLGAADDVLYVGTLQGSVYAVARNGKAGDSIKH